MKELIINSQREIEKIRIRITIEEVFGNIRYLYIDINISLINQNRIRLPLNNIIKRTEDFDR